MVNVIGQAIAVIPMLSDTSGKSLFDINLAETPRAPEDAEIWLTCPDFLYRIYKKHNDDINMIDLRIVGSPPLHRQILCILFLLYVFALVPPLLVILTELT